MAGETLLGPLQGPMRVGDMLADMEKTCSCPTPGAVPTLLLGSRLMCPDDIVEESAALLTLTWKSALASRIEDVKACQDKEASILARLREIDELNVKVCKLVFQAEDRIYNTLDESSLTDCLQDDERVYLELTEIMTMLKAGAWDTQETEGFLCKCVLQARWLEILFNAYPLVGTQMALHDGDTDAHMRAAFHVLAGTDALAMDLSTLKSAVEKDTDWSNEDVQTMFDATDQDRDGLISLSDIDHIMKAFIPTHCLTYSDASHCLTPLEEIRTPLTLQRIDKLKAMLLTYHGQEVLNDAGV